jgi:hypothetical protein
MNDDARYSPRPADYKSTMDGLGGLVRIPLEGGPHQGEELFIDEPDVQPEIYASPDPGAFSWWPADRHEIMAKTALGGDPANPPTRYVLRVDDATRQPRYVPDPGD